MDDISLLIKKLQDELSEHRRRYYELNDPIISDIEYDALYEQFLNYKKKYPEIVDAIGWKPYGNTFDHKYKMLSLNSTRDLITVIGVFAHVKDNISCEPKIDGLSLELVYHDHDLIAASTRGDGDIGEDVTPNVRLIRIPQNIDEKNACVYGEVYLTKDAFNKVNKIRLSEGKSIYSNSRNAAAGILRSNESTHYLQYLQFFPYTVKGINRLSSQCESFNWLEANGFDVLSDHILNIKYVDDIYEYHNRMNELRDTLPFDIDGLVFKVDNFKIQNKLGASSHYPKWAIAFKFKPTSVQTRLIDVIFQVGKSGIIAPVAIFDPTNIRGSIVTKASLANKNNIKTKDIRIGDIVSLSMANDVIPYVDEVSFTDRSGKEQVIVFPTHCPECHQPTSEMNVHVVCTNKDCPAQILGRIVNAVSRRGFNIKGLGPTILNRLIDHKLIGDISDIFNLSSKKNIDEMRQLNIGDKTINNIINEINMSKRISLRKFIFALGITDVSIGVSAKLAEHYGTLVNLISSIQSFGVFKLPNVNSQTFDYINEYFTTPKNVTMITKIVDGGVIVENDVIQQNVCNVVITGLLSSKRADFEKTLNDAGFRLLNNVSKNVSILVVGENGSSIKIETARRLNIEILSEEEMIYRMNK